MMDNNDEDQTEDDTNLSDCLDLSDLNNLSKAGHQGILLFQRLHQLKVRQTKQRQNLKELSTYLYEIWEVLFDAN